MLNKVMLIGHLGNDPEIKFTQAGIQCTTFTMATTERYKDKDGNQQETTEWHRIVTWQKLAETCGEYLHKGSKVYIEGKITTRKWQDGDGKDKFTTEIVCKEMKMLNDRSSSNE